MGISQTLPQISDLASWERELAKAPTVAPATGGLWVDADGFSRFSRTEPGIYVDSVNGHDSHDGSNPLDAVQTLARAQAMATAGDTVFLARGSHWREQYDVLVNSLTIAIHGTGNMPVIDGSDIVTDPWTQHDATNFPNVWNVSWTRAAVGSTGHAKLSLWADDGAPRFAESLSDLQENGGFWIADTQALTTTVYIRSISDPNSNGVVYEISRRGHGINGHDQNTPNPTATAQTVVGPIEIKNCVEHYNAHSAGPGTAKGLLLRDGNIHHMVTEGKLTEDALAIGVAPVTETAAPFTAYRDDSPGFEHAFRRCGTIFTGGSDRVDASSKPNHSAFSAHGSTPTPTIEELRLEECFVHGGRLGGADSKVLVVKDCYGEECGFPLINAAISNLRVQVDRVMARDLTAVTNSGGNLFLRRQGAATSLSLNHICAYTLRGVSVNSVAGGSVVSTHSVLIGAGGGWTGGGPTINHSFLGGNGRPLNNLTTAYRGDYNVFDFSTQPWVQLGWNGGTYQLNQFQDATGQDLNSVFLKPVDQTRGNANAFWPGVAEDTNDGPADGDYRINPNAVVYQGDHQSTTQYVGTFADGVTPITNCGPQEQWDWGLRKVVSGPPSRFPLIPKTFAQCRQWIEDPNAWEYYPS